MKRYLGVISIIIFISTIILFNTMIKDIYLVIGFGLSILTALFSTKKWKIILLTVYGFLILAILFIVTTFGIFYEGP